MRKYFGVFGFITAIGAVSSAIFTADSGIASAAEAVDPAQAEILVDPSLIASTDAEGGEQAQDQDLDETELQPIAALSQPTVGDLSSEEAIEQLEAAAEVTPATLRELVQAQPRPDSLDREMECLAGTVYFESKGESLDGQLAVAEVVLARRDSRRWPNSICGVVYQRSQFSFVRGGRMPRINKSSRAWRNAVAIAQIATDRGWESPVKGSYFFHARYVSPGWRLQRVGSVDNHIFYR